jgi:hypothetical protein
MEFNFAHGLTVVDHLVAYQFRHVGFMWVVSLDVGDKVCYP